MEFGFYLPCYWPDTSVPAERMYAEMLEEAQLAEDIGLVSLTIPEHHFVNYLVHPSPPLTAVRVAAATKRIPLVSAVLVLPFYDMRRLAGEIAQADCLTGGRIQLGVGRGAFLRYEFDRFGVPGLVFQSDGSDKALRAGNVSAVNITVSGLNADFEQACDQLALWLGRLARPDSAWHLVLDADDIAAARKRGKLGLIMGWQNMRPLGDNSPAELPAATDALLRRGWREAEVEGLLGRNYLRVLPRIWCAAAQAA